MNLAYKWFIGINPGDSLPDASQLSRFLNHRLGASQIEDVLKHVVGQCIEQGLVKSKAVIMDATHTQAGSRKQRPLEVLRDAAKRRIRVVIKRHSKLEKKLPKLPRVKSEQADAAQIMLGYLAQPANAASARRYREVRQQRRLPENFPFPYRFKLV